MSNELERLRTLTIAQLAEASGIPRWRLYSEIAEGRGPAHFKVGKTIRIRVQDAEAWMLPRTTAQSESC